MVEIPEEDWRKMWAAFYNDDVDDQVATDIAWEHFRIPPTLTLRLLSRLARLSAADGPKGAKIAGAVSREHVEAAHNACFIPISEARFVVGRARRLPGAPSDVRSRAQDIYSLLRVKGYSEDQIQEMDSDLILASLMETAVMPVIYDTRDSPVSI